MAGDLQLWVRGRCDGLCGDASALTIADRVLHGERRSYRE
jgi:hypothetical protein